MNKIGILFIGTGIYNTFWDDFYETVNRNFCISSVKLFYVFTDDITLYENKPHENVSVYQVEDRGWVLNIIKKSIFFLEIEDILKCNDFLFYLNGNYKVLCPIFDHEILPTEENEWLSILSFDFYANISPDNYTYDRNPCSQAYIPFGSGKYYLQGGFYGGRTQNFLEMAHWLKKQTDIDLLNKIIPLYHDESYVNKYFLHRNPKIIPTAFAKNVWWDGDSKAVLLDKDQFFNKVDMAYLKCYFSEPCLSFLVDDDFQPYKIGVIKLSDTMLMQKTYYEAMFNLVDSFPNRQFYISDEELSDKSKSKMEEILCNNEISVIDPIILKRVSKVKRFYIKEIAFFEMNDYKQLESSLHPIWIILEIPIK